MFSVNLSPDYQFAGHLYTGTADGKILDIVGDEMKVLAKLGSGECGW